MYMPNVQEVTLTRQHQITIPKGICANLHLEGGDRFEVMIVSGNQLVLKPKKLIDANDPAYRLGQEILEAEQQITRGEVVEWSAIKRRHGL